MLDTSCWTHRHVPTQLRPLLDVVAPDALHSLLQALIPIPMACRMNCKQLQCVLLVSEESRRFKAYMS